MIYDREKIKLWIENIISPLTQIADLEFQKRAWLASNAYLSFAETACSLYDSSMFQKFLEECSANKWLPEHLINSLKRFDIEFEKYTDSHGTYLIEEEMQTDPEWHKIVYLAQALIKEFKLLGYNPPNLS